MEHIRGGLAASPAADLKLSIASSVTIDDDIAAGIIRVAEDGKEAEVFGSSDVIAMATHGYSGLHSSRLPLLIVRLSDMRDKGHQSQSQATTTEIQEGAVSRQERC